MSDPYIAIFADVHSRASISGRVVVSGSNIPLSSLSTGLTYDKTSATLMMTGRFDTSGGTLTEISFIFTAFGQEIARYSVSANVSLQQGSYIIMAVVYYRPK